MDAIKSLLLLDEESPSHEVIIVDNNSTDNTRDLVHALIPTSAGRLRYVFEGRQGLSHGRNAGISASRGEIIAFTDDDVRVSSSWLVALAKAFEARPNAVYGGGKVLPDWPKSPPTWYSHDRHSSPLALADYGEDILDITATAFRCLVGANFAVRRWAFDSHGGFDPRYQHLPGAVSATEDHEFQARLLGAGYSGFYAPSALIHAEVQEKRLKARYHRRWHFDHGRAVARMAPPGFLFDGHCSYLPMSTTAKQVGGLPLYLVRSALSALRDTLRELARADFDSARSALHEALEQLGAIHYFITIRRRGEDRELYEAAAPGIHSVG